MSTKPIELGHGRLLIDLRFRDKEGIIGSYLLPEPDGRWALVETGPSSCFEQLASGLEDAGIEPAQVADVFLTHIHLDHAGAAGTLLRRYPGARVHVHQSGVAHLIDPSRLVSSARRAWGDASDQIWGRIESAQEERVLPLEGGERFPVEGGSLQVVATPGHARHHVSYFDSSTRAILTGDSAGVRLPGGWRPRPAIPPPDLDIELLLGSVERMQALDAAAVWFTHFGPSPDGPSDLTRYHRAVEEWARAGLEAAQRDPSIPSVAAALERAETSAAERAGARASRPDRTALISGYELAAQGLLRYYRTKGRIPG